MPHGSRKNPAWKALVAFVATAPAPFTADQALSALLRQGHDISTCYVAGRLSRWVTRKLLKHHAPGTRGHPAVFCPEPTLTPEKVQAVPERSAWTPPPPTEYELRWREFRATLDLPETPDL